MKTNKSFTKRFKITGTGKLLARKAGQNHFNAKASRSSQLAGKRLNIIKFDQKIIDRNMPYSHAR